MQVYISCSDRSFTETTADASSVRRSLFGNFLARRFFSFDCSVFVQKYEERETGFDSVCLATCLLFTITFHSRVYRTVSSAAGRNGTPRPWLCCCGWIGLASRVSAIISDGCVDGLSLGISIVSSTRKSVESNCVQKSSRSRYDARRGSARVTRLGIILPHFVYVKASLWQTGCWTSQNDVGVMAGQKRNVS